jgi:hypothetical protein
MAYAKMRAARAAAPRNREPCTLADPPVIGGEMEVVGPVTAPVPDGAAPPSGVDAGGETPSGVDAGGETPSGVETGVSGDTVTVE